MTVFIHWRLFARLLAASRGFLGARLARRCRFWRSSNVHPFNSLASDSPVYMVDVFGARPGVRDPLPVRCRLRSICSCGLRLHWSLFVLAGTTSTSSACLSPRPTSSRYWRSLSTRRSCRSLLFDWVAVFLCGFGQHNATNSPSQGPKGDHHVRKPRSRKILAVVYD